MAAPNNRVSQPKSASAIRNPANPRKTPATHDQRKLGVALATAMVPSTLMARGKLGQTGGPRKLGRGESAGLVRSADAKPGGLARAAAVAARELGGGGAARADLGLERGEFCVDLRVRAGLVEFLLDVVGVPADV